MGIKAIGVVTKSHGDGQHVGVDWEPRLDPVREWYFFTNRSTVWHVLPGEWITDGEFRKLASEHLLHKVYKAIKSDEEEG